VTVVVVCSLVVVDVVVVVVVVDLQTGWQTTTLMLSPVLMMALMNWPFWGPPTAGPFGSDGS